MSRRTTTLILALGVITLATPGCTPEQGAVSGRVTYRRQPLAGATILFYEEGQRVRSCVAGADGGYRAAHVAPGKVRVAVVVTPAVPPGLVRANCNAPKEVRAPQGTTGGLRIIGPSASAERIPTKYASPERSGLALQVVRGEQSWDIDLQPENTR